MKWLAFLVMATAWVCVWWAPSSGASRIVQFLVFGTLGAVFTVAGGLSYWWDACMRPTQASSFLFVCGLLTLASQGLVLLRGLFENEGGTPWPERKNRRK